MYRMLGICGYALVFICTLLCSEAAWSQERLYITPIKSILPSDGVPNYALAVDGDTIVVGSQYHDSTIVDSGAAYIFQQNQGGDFNWGELKTLTPHDSVYKRDYFGGSVAISGDTIAIGSIGNDLYGNNAGGVYIYERNHGGVNNWGFYRRVSATTMDAGCQFGYKVALDGDILVVTNRVGPDCVVNVDKVYIFNRNQGGVNKWGEVKEISIGTHISGLERDIAVSGDVVAVGNQDNNHAGSGSGAVHIYSRDQGGPGNWGLVKMLTASDAAQYDNFGVSVDIHGNTIVVGANKKNTNNVIYSGAAYIFDRNFGGPNNWGEVKKLRKDFPYYNDRYGRGVMIYGDVAVIIAYLDSAPNSKPDEVYFYGRDKGGKDNWGLLNDMQYPADAEQIHFATANGAIGKNMMLLNPLSLPRPIDLYALNPVYLTPRDPNFYWPQFLVPMMKKQ